MVAREAGSIVAGMIHQGLSGWVGLTYQPRPSHVGSTFAGT